jgi:signal peptidase I
MTPYDLLGLVAVILLARIILSLRPVAASSNGRSIAIAREYLDPFIYAGAAAWLLITFVARTYYIPSESMVPTLQVHDVLLVDKFEYHFHKPSEGDVVVFPPPIPTPDDFIKRVVGLPGDKLRVQGGVVYINDKPLDEPYIAAKPDYSLKIANYGIQVNDGFGWHPLSSDEANVPPKSQWTTPDTIPPGCYMMFGDNRNDSEDSHVWGFAQLDGTFATGPRKGERAGFTGRAFLIFYPVSQMKILK